MNAPCKCFAIALLAGLSFGAAAQQDAASELPSVQVQTKTLAKRCDVPGSRYLHPLEVASRLGRERSAETDRLRDIANHAARRLCLQGYTHVEFTFVHSPDPRQVAILAGAATGPAN